MRCRCAGRVAGLCGMSGEFRCPEPGSTAVARASPLPDLAVALNQVAPLRGAGPGVSAGSALGGIPGVRSVKPLGNIAAGEGIQNLMCATQAAAVLLGLSVVATWPAGWPVDPVIAPGHRRVVCLGRPSGMARGRLLLALLSEEEGEPGFRIVFAARSR